MPRRKKDIIEPTGWYAVWSGSGKASYLPYNRNTKSVANVFGLFVIGLLTLGFYVLFSESNDGMKGRH